MALDARGTSRAGGRPSSRSRNSRGYSCLSPIGRASSSLSNSSLAPAADSVSLPVSVTELSGRGGGTLGASNSVATDGRPSSRECGHEVTGTSRKPHASYTVTRTSPSVRPKQKRRPTTSAGVLLLKDYAFGTFGPREVPRRIHSANAQQRPRNDSPLTAFNSEPDRRPPSRQRPPPEALHLELPNQSIHGHKLATATFRNHFPRPPQTSAGVRLHHNKPHGHQRADDHHMHSDCGPLHALPHDHGAASFAVCGSSTGKAWPPGSEPRSAWAADDSSSSDSHSSGPISSHATAYANISSSRARTASKSKRASIDHESLVSSLHDLCIDGHKSPYLPRVMTSSRNGTHSRGQHHRAPVGHKASHAVGMGSSKHAANAHRPRGHVHGHISRSRPTTREGARGKQRSGASGSRPSTSSTQARVENSLKTQGLGIDDVL